MAAPRCVRPFFGPAKRVKIIPPRSYTQTFSRAKSSNADDEFDNNAAVEDVKDVENMTLDERLEYMGIDAAEYKSMYKSQRAAERKFAAWEPKTSAEAAARWKELQSSPDDLSMLQMYKRAGVQPIKLAKERKIGLPGGEKEPLDPELQKQVDELRTPINVQAIDYRPLRRSPEHGVPVCDLQLRTYSIRNLLLFADFAMRAAYYMGLPARGPIPLPRITERWTVPRSNFIFKKSQENFERITMRRLIQIQDGHPDVVKAWLAFLQKHQYYGVGMKANIWEYESLEDATRVGVKIEEGDYSRRREGPMLEKVKEILGSDKYKDAMKEYKNPVELRM